jgi:hypothetical protein
VGATFYLEPIATLDVDIFVMFKSGTGGAILSPQPIFDYVKARGGAMQGEYIVIAGWPVQFLPPTGPLAEEALAEAVTSDVEGTPARAEPSVLDQPNQVIGDLGSGQFPHANPDLLLRVSLGFEQLQQPAGGEGAVGLGHPALGE